ncbi:hypothetical protein ACQ4LE_009197 [Meloidogyne hapla]
MSTKSSNENNSKENNKEEEENKKEQKNELKENNNKSTSLDALYAAAREEFDLDLSPTESAIKTLKEGREIQKLNVIRNLGELFENEPKETIEKIIPLLQEILNIEPSNLDMHCEAAIVFKNCIKDRKLRPKCPELPEILLNVTLENIEIQKENVTAAAWLESLVDISEAVSQQSVISIIVPLAISQSDSSRRVQRRIISTRLIEKLAALVPKEILQRELCPCVQMLCRDPSTSVRTSIAQRLVFIAQALNNSADSSALLLPCIIELCKDEDPAVREATLGTLDDCLPHFSKESKKSILSPLLRKCAEQSLIMRDASLPLIAKHLGVWLQSMKEIISGPSEMRWWLDLYIRILDFGNYSNNQQQQNSKNKSAALSSNTNNTFATNGCIHNNAGSAASYEHLRTCCRRMCAYNFPCIVSVFGQDQQLFCSKLLPILERFCRDPDEEVRSTVASGFHEVLAQRSAFFEGASTNLKSKQNEQQPQLLNPFVELLSSSSGSSEVIQHLTGNLEKILPVLYKEINFNGNKKNAEKLQTKLNQLIISCNSLLRGTGFWRAHEAYLNSIASLKNILCSREIKQNFVPLLKQEVLNAKALPCRIAAANSLLLLMRQLPLASDRLDIVKFFTERLGQHLSCYRRRLLLDIVPTLLHNFSREFFVEQFLPAILKLSLDPISNIRLQLCRTLPTIRRYLVFPKDDDCLSSLERIVRDLLASEQNLLSRQLIQQFACELSRTESDKKECRANRTKLTEEKKLWTEVEENEEEKKVEVKEEIKIEENKIKENVEEKPKEEKPKEIPKKPLIKKKKQRERETGSPESGIFIDEEEENKQQNKEELIRSATTTNVPVHVLQPPSKHTSAQIPHSLSSDTIAQLAAYEATSTKPSSSSSIPPPVPPKPNRRPPPPSESLPPPTASSSIGTAGWRRNFPSSSYSSQNFSVNSSTPKMAITRPQPQVTVVQRACSPMPSCDRKNSYSSMIGLERGSSRENSVVRENSVGTSTRNSRLPLSTARYRSNTSTTTPNTQVQHLANKFMISSGDGTEPVTDSLRLNKYKPRNSVTSYSSPSKSSPKINTRVGQVQTMSRSASALPPPSSTRNRRSVSPGINIIGQNSLQTSASYSSISAAANSGNGFNRIIQQQQQTQRRPYGLLRVQSTSSAVERKPAQIRCQVISMN